MIAHQVAGKATRDALFLSHFDVSNLPKVVIAAAIISLMGVLVISRLLARYGPAKLIPLTFTVSAVLFIGEWMLFGIRPDIAAVVLYLHMAVFGAVLISGFWSVINERFNPHAAKRRIARIAAAATLGGIVGGIVAERVTTLVDVRAMLLVLSFLHVICALSVFGVGPAGRSGQTQAPPEVRSGFSTLRRTPYLRWMGLLMLLVALAAAFLDYAFKAEASARYT
ncbi:MAG: MFS transporter, partial [Gammaproteobacteria bacterium]